MHRELNKSAKQNVKVWTLYFIWEANVGFNLKKEYFSPSLENIFSETICQRESFFSYLSLNLTEWKVCLCCKFKQPNYSFRHQTDNVAPAKLWNWERGFGVWGPFPMSTVLCPTLFQNWNKSNFIVKFKSIFFNLKLPQLTTYIFYNIKNIFFAWGLFLIFRFRKIYFFGLKLIYSQIGEKYIVTIFKCIWCLRAISYV